LDLFPFFYDLRNDSFHSGAIFVIFDLPFFVYTIIVVIIDASAELSATSVFFDATFCLIGRGEFDPDDA